MKKFLYFCLVLIALFIMSSIANKSSSIYENHLIVNAFDEDDDFPEIIHL